MSNFRSDPDRYTIIKRKKPSKLELAANPNTHYYAGFRIDKLRGPYLYNSKWCIDTKFWRQMDKIYAIPVKDILNDEEQEVHDGIIENIKNESWRPHFIAWFSFRAAPQPLLHSEGDMIFSKDKYIKISWVADLQQRLCWNGTFYAKNAMLYGGKAINVYESIKQQQVIYSTNSPMYYASNISEVVASNFCTTTASLLSLAHYEQTVCMKQTLYLHLRKIPMYYLRHNKFGKEKELEVPILYRTFVPYMVQILRNKHIYYEQTKKDLFFNLNDQTGDEIFEENIFSRMYGNDKVFAYSIQFIHSTKRDNLDIKFYVLQQDQSTPNAQLLGYDIVNN